MIDLYGVRNPDAKGRGAGIPHPGIIVVDREGRVVSKLFYESYRPRHGVDEVLAAANAIGR